MLNALNVATNFYILIAQWYRQFHNLKRHIPKKTQPKPPMKKIKNDDSLRKHRQMSESIDRQIQTRKPIKTYLHDNTINVDDIHRDPIKNKLSQNTTRDEIKHGTAPHDFPQIPISRVPL